MGLGESEVEEILVSYDQELDYSTTALFSQVPALLERWSSRFPLAVVSSAHPDTITARLKQDNLLDYFGAVVGSDDGTTDKRGILRQAMELLDCQQGWMVGDTGVDVEAARANGLTAVGVSYGWWNEERLRATEPDHMLECLADLEPLLS